MEFAGYLAEDAPDPRTARLGLIASLGVPVAGLVPQRYLEERGEAGVASSRRRRGDGPETVEDATVSRTYVLWRNPDDHEDPVNLADLDEATRATLEAPLERPIPEWLQEARRMLRYPRLWEAVQTHWTRPGVDRPTVAERLVAHTEYVLTNSYREQLGLGDDPMQWVPSIPAAALQPTSIGVDGRARQGLKIDTDPFVVAIGVELDDGRVVTVVVPRDELPLLTLELASDLPV